MPNCKNYATSKEVLKLHVCKYVLYHFEHLTHRKDSYEQQSVLHKERIAVYNRLVARSSVQLKRRTAVSANITIHISAALDVYTNRLLACSAKSLSQMV